MKKKFIVLGIISIIILFVLGYFTYAFGWLEFRANNYTPKEYKTIVSIPKKQYSKDSMELVSIIKDQINKHKDPYSNAVRVNGELEFINDSNTHIYIDSIFYSPDSKKIAFLVIVENENKKLYLGKTTQEINNLVEEGNLSFNGSHFDGKSFITEKKNTVFDEIYSFSRYSFTNYKSYKETSESLRDACLNHKEVQNEKTYNLDDKRFWNSKVWYYKKQYEAKVKEFNNEKKHSK